MQRLTSIVLHLKITLNCNLRRRFLTKRLRSECSRKWWKRHSVCWAQSLNDRGRVIWLIKAPRGSLHPTSCQKQLFCICELWRYERRVFLGSLLFILRIDKFRSIPPNYYDTDLRKAETNDDFVNMKSEILNISTSVFVKAPTESPFSAWSKLPVLSHFSESIISQKTNHTTLQWSFVNFTGGQLSSNNCGSVCFLLFALLHYTDDQAFPWTIMMTKKYVFPFPQWRKALTKFGRERERETLFGWCKEVPGSVIGVENSTAAKWGEIIWTWEWI